MLDKDTSSKAERGLTLIYTGNGKGKTTAAMGLALRAAGYGKKVMVIQFVKAWFTGEKAAFSNFGGTVDFVQGGRGFYGIRGDKLPPSEHLDAAAATLKLASQAMRSRRYDVVVLDEIIGCIPGKLLTLKQVTDVMDHKPFDLDLVLTGHRAREFPVLIQRADLVTEMVKIKHPFDSGIMAKQTIDY